MRIEESPRHAVAEANFEFVIARPRPPTREAPRRMNKNALSDFFRQGVLRGKLFRIMAPLPPVVESSSTRSARLRRAPAQCRLYYMHAPAGSRTGFRSPRHHIS